MSERGASSWLTTILVAEHGFTLHKQDFRDALSFRYGWRPLRLPSHCHCGEVFSVSHVLSCPKGAFPFICHSCIKDLLAWFFTEVCPNVSIEPASPSAIEWRDPFSQKCQYRRQGKAGRQSPELMGQQQEECILQ